MPLVSTRPICKDESLLSDVAKWVIEYGRGRVGYQNMAKTTFVYRVPTMGELLDLEVAESQNGAIAAHAFLKKIGLTPIPRARPADIMKLMESIVNDHFPKGEEALTMSLLEYTHTHMTTMIGAIDAHLIEMGSDITSRDMTYNEVLEMLAIKQLITQRPILKGSMPRSQKGRTNATARTDPRRNAGAQA